MLQDDIQKNKTKKGVSNAHTSELVYNFKDAFQKETFEEKLVDVLKNKPYIVGDISHEKLRLTGFILTKDNNNPKNINNLEDYILEYCNFGAPFFVVKKRNS